MSVTIPDALPTLSHGAHEQHEGRACVMEYVSVLAGERWTDHPRCTHNSIAAMARALNDTLYDQNRHLLLPLIPRLLKANVPDNQQVALGEALDKALADYLNTTQNGLVRAIASMYKVVHPKTDHLIAVISSTRFGGAEEQVELLVLMLDTLDKFRGEQRVSYVSKERMARAVARVEGVPVDLPKTTIGMKVKALVAISPVSKIVPIQPIDGGMWVPVDADKPVSIFEYTSQ